MKKTFILLLLLTLGCKDNSKEKKVKPEDIIYDDKKQEIVIRNFNLLEHINDSALNYRVAINDAFNIVEVKSNILKTHNKVVRQYKSVSRYINKPPIDIFWKASVIYSFDKEKKIRIWSVIFKSFGFIPAYSCNISSTRIDIKEENSNIECGYEKGVK